MPIPSRLRAATLPSSKKRRVQQIVFSGDPDAPEQPKKVFGRAALRERERLENQRLEHQRSILGSETRGALVHAQGHMEEQSENDDVQTFSQPEDQGAEDWETDSEDGVPQTSFLRSNPGVPYWKKYRPKIDYKKLMTNANDNWTRILDDLYWTYVLYHKESEGFQAPLLDETGALDLHANQCTCPNNQFSQTQVLTFVLLDRQQKAEVSWCDCTPRAVRLLRMGFLAASPTAPSTAIALSLLQFLHTLWQHSPLAIDAFSKALWAHHSRRGGVYYAKNSLNARKPGNLIRAAFHVYRYFISQDDEMFKNLLDMSLRREHAAQCPACFGPRKDGDLPEGATEVHVAVDANFTQSRHHKAAKYDFQNIAPSSFLPDQYVEHAKGEYNRSGSDSVRVGKDETACSDNWKAKDGGAGKKAFEGKEDTGLVAMVCRHGVCLRQINLFRSGEKMYYPLALVQYILRDVDPHVRLGLLYDIGCNFEAHLVKRNLLSKERAEKRLKIGVAVFHAYAHNWLCQMRYNPRITTGFALTDGEDTERHWSSLSPLVRLNREASRSLRLNNIHHLTKFINENKLLELVGFIKDRFIKTKKMLSDAENDLLQVQNDGNVCEEELRAEWERQKKAQSAEGEIEAAAERSRKYEKLGDLIFLWDRVKPLLEALKDAVKTNDTSVMRDAQIVLNSLAEKQSLHGPKISEEALGLTRKGFSEEEVKNLCRIHAAKCVLRREYDKHKATMRPMQEAQDGLRPPLGQLAVQKLHRNLKSQDKKRNLAVLNYQQAVQIYLASDRPKVAVQTVENWKELKDKREDDIFWMDVIFGAENGALWATNSYYLNGIDALRRRDCCNEELELLTAETARLIRWCQNHSDKITKALAEWETAKGDWLTYEAQLGTSQMAREEESAEEPMKPGLGSNVQECLSVIHILRRRQYEHFHLEERWVADGLYSLWSVHIQQSALGAPLETVVKDIYTRVWDARDDESTAVNDGRSISTSLYQQKDLSRDISSTILALERREETPEGERDDWDGFVQTAEEDPENEEGWVDEE